MSLFDDIKLYLPKYLSVESEKDLFVELNRYPNNPKNSYYTDLFQSEENVLQGDGLNKLFIGDFPENRVKEGPVIILSNTCDIDPENKRLLTPRVFYCPILRLSSYEKAIRESNEKISDQKISDHIAAIKKQEISSIFYLPNYPTIKEDCIALLDRINSCKNDYLTPEKIKSMKLFSLSNFGFYLFLIKISIHMTRVRENIDRVQSKAN